MLLDVSNFLWAPLRLLAHCEYRHMERDIQRNWQQDSLRNGDLILSKICCGHCLWNERKTALEGPAASFVLYLFTFSGVAIHVQLLFYLVWVLFSTLRKAVMLIAHCKTDSLKTSKVNHYKRQNDGYSLSSLTAKLTCDECTSRVLWAGKQNKLNVWKKIFEKIVRTDVIFQLLVLFSGTIIFFCQWYQSTAPVLSSPM